MVIDKKNEIKKILVRRVDNLGDSILVIPVIRELRKYFREAEFALMVKPEHSAVFFKYADIIVDPKPIKTLNHLKHSYDLIINVEYSLPKNYIPKPIEPNQVIHIGAINGNKKQHVYRHLLDGVAAHGIPVSFRKPRVYLSSQARRKAKEWITRNSLNSSLFNVAINPGSRFPEKMWSVSKYREVCKWLMKNYNANILIIGKEKVSTELFIALNNDNVNVKLLSHSPIDIVAAILTKYDLFIGNDSGISHLAAAVGVPTVTIFGPTSPGAWKPVGRKSVVVFNHNLDFDPKIKNSPLYHKEVLNAISTKDVIDGTILSITKHIGLSTKPCLDAIEVSKALNFKDTINGIIITHSETHHSCLINRGWDHIAKILDEVNETSSFSKTLAKFPDARQLLEFFMLHRVIKSANIQ